MPIYDGLVTLADHEIPVIVELDDSRIRLSASGEEIGEWSVEECEISHVADTRFAIRAEDETLTFVPSQPALFAAAVGNGNPAQTQPEPSAPRETADDTGTAEAPPPRPLTVGLFYAISLATAILAIWSLIQILL